MDIDKKYTRRQVLKVVTSASIAGFLKIDPIKKRNLFTIHLSGGNDALNTVIPYADRNYYRARKSLAIKSDEVVKLDERYGLHPSLHDLKAIYNRGDLAIILGVGHPDQSMSHDLSSKIFKSGIVDGLRSNFRYEGKPVLSSNGSFEQISFLKKSSGLFPAKVLQHIVLDGFDTHINQLDRHAESLKNFADLVLNLQNKYGKNCLIYAYSEFGRAIIPNKDGGFDHGVAGLSMLIGPSVEGGIYGGYGNLNKKAGEDFIDMAVDFRSVLSALA